LRKQKGFQDEITFAIPGGTDVVAISLWDTKENAEAYTPSLPGSSQEPGQGLGRNPKVRVSDVISSTCTNRPGVAAEQFVL